MTLLLAHPAACFSSACFSCVQVSGTLPAPRFDNDAHHPQQQRLSRPLFGTVKEAMSALKDLEQKEKELILHLRESIEELRETLLEQTQEYGVRDTVNQNFIDTRTQIKKDLRQLRDAETAKLESSAKELMDTVHTVDEGLTPMLEMYVVDESWSEVKETLKQVPEMAATLSLMDALWTANEKFVYDNSSNVAKGIKVSMDHFKSDMEDQLEDLQGNIRFQIRISDDKSVD